MRRWALVFAVIPLLLLGEGESKAPALTSVDPAQFRAGEVVTAVGVGLDKARVAEVYLTDGVNDVKVAIVEQNAEMIKFRAGADAKPGAYNVMLSTTHNPPLLLVQPVRCTVVPARAK